MATNVATPDANSCGDCEDLCKIQWEFNARLAATVTDVGQPNAALRAKPLPPMTTGADGLVTAEPLSTMREAAAWLAQKVFRFRATLAKVGAASLTHMGTAEAAPSLHAHPTVLFAHMDAKLMKHGAHPDGLKQWVRQDSGSACNSSRTLCGLPLQYRDVESAVAILGMEHSCETPYAFNVEGTGPSVNYPLMPIVTAPAEMQQHERLLLVAATRAMPPTPVYRTAAVATAVGKTVDRGVYGTMTGDVALEVDQAGTPVKLPILVTAASNCMPFSQSSGVTPEANHLVSQQSTTYLEPQRLSDFYDVAVTFAAPVLSEFPSLAETQLRSVESQAVLGIQPADVFRSDDLQYYSHAENTCIETTAEGTKRLTKGIKVPLLTVAGHRCACSVGETGSAGCCAAAPGMTPLGRRTKDQQLQLRDLLLRQESPPTDLKTPPLVASHAWNMFMETHTKERQSDETHFVSWFKVDAGCAATGRRIPTLLAYELNKINQGLGHSGSDRGVAAGASVLKHVVMQPAANMTHGARGGALFFGLQTPYAYYNNQALRTSVYTQLVENSKATKYTPDSGEPMYVSIAGLLGFTSSTRSPVDGAAGVEQRVPTMRVMQPRPHQIDRPLGHLLRPRTIGCATAAAAVVPQPSSPQASSVGGSACEPEPEVAADTAQLRLQVGATMIVHDRTLTTTPDLVTLLRYFETQSSAAHFTVDDLAARTELSADTVKKIVTSARLRQANGSDRAYIHDAFELLGPTVIVSDFTSDLLRKNAEGVPSAGYAFACAT